MTTFTSQLPMLGLIVVGISPNSLRNMSDKKGQGSPWYYKGEFSVVNKDARNIDNKSHNAAVSWHIMNKYERFKKHEKQRDWELRQRSLRDLCPYHLAQLCQLYVEVIPRRRRKQD